MLFRSGPSRRSRVVPATGLTMALLAGRRPPNPTLPPLPPPRRPTAARANRLNRVDLPTFGRPTIGTDSSPLTPDEDNPRVETRLGVCRRTCTSIVHRAWNIATFLSRSQVVVVVDAFSARFKKILLLLIATNVERAIELQRGTTSPSEERFIESLEPIRSTYSKKVVHSRSADEV